MTNLNSMQALPPAPPETPVTKAQLAGQLVSKNIRIRGHRTSVRLEPEMWDALQEVAALEGCSIHDLCTGVEELRHPEASFTGALRVFLMEYFRTAAKTNRPVSLIQKKVADKDVKSR